MANQPFESQDQIQHFMPHTYSHTQDRSKFVAGEQVSYYQTLQWNIILNTGKSQQHGNQKCAVSFSCMWIKWLRCIKRESCLFFLLQFKDMLKTIKKKQCHQENVCVSATCHLFSCTVVLNAGILHTTLPCSGHFHRDHPENMFDFYVFIILENMVAL